MLGVYRDITELKDREQALAWAKEDIERTRAVMQTILDNMNDGVILLDADFNFVFGNEQFMDKLKVPPSVAAAGKSVEDIIRYQAARGDFGPTDDVERTVKERRAMMLTPGGVRYERKTVSGRHLEFNYQPLADGGLLGVHRDITEIKEREQAVEQARGIMQSVLDNMSDGVTLFDSDYRLKFTNQRLIDFLKLPPEAVEPGLSLMDILRYQARRGDFGPVEEAEYLAGARFDFITQPGGCYFERRTADKHLDFRFIPLPNGDTIAVTRDITELKDREQALATSKEAAETARDEVERTHQIMQTVFDNLGDGVSLFDKDFRWVFSNRHHRELHGYTPDKIQPGDSALKLIRHTITRGEYGPLDDLDIDAQVAEVAARMRKPGGNRYERRAYGGRYIEYIFRELEDGGLLGVYHDITELREREAALAVAKEAAEAARVEAELATQAKSTFLATMSHEIRTPMNGVLGMMEMLEHQGLDQEQLKSVATMRDSAQALLRIIDDLLDFSKIEAGRLELEETAFSLSGLITGALDTFRPQASAKGLLLEAYDRRRLERRAGRRSDPGAADPVQPPVERAEVHQQGRRRGARLNEPARRRLDARHARGARHRHRLERRAAGAAVPAVRAGRFLDHAPIRRHRPRPFHRAAPDRVDGRQRRHPEHAGPGLDLHGDADAQGCAGGFAARGVAAARCGGEAGRAARRAASGSACWWSTTIRSIARCWCASSI